MSFITRIWGSSLGKKYIMAISGLILLLFVIGHMVGNLLVFLGPSYLNEYGNFLQTTPEILWPARIILLLMLVLHFVSAAQLTLENRSSRGVAYNEYDVVASSFAARTMIISGFIVLFFVIYHLLHFTFESPQVNLSGQNFRTFAYMEGAKERHDIYRMMIVGFQQPVVSAFYMLGIALLCAHLSHGASSMFQSMGWRSNYYRKFVDRVALIAAIVIFLGYVSVPSAVLVGVLNTESGGAKSVQTHPAPVKSPEAKAQAVPVSSTADLSLKRP